MKTVKVPKSCRTKIEEIPEENMIGIKVTKMQLAIFAKILGHKFIDQTIPLAEEEQVNYPRLKHVGFLLHWQKIAANATDSPKSFQ